MSRFIMVFLNKRMLVTLLLGFSGGLPFALVGSTLQAWLSVEKIDISTIGAFALVGLPYTLKFLWAPLMDEKTLPIIGRLGLRRSWLAVTQVGLFAATIGLAFCSPSQSMGMFTLMAFLTTFFAASQDIVIDAYRTEIIEDKSEVGVGASTYISGYRLATVVSGGVALAMADHMSWTTVYLIMAAINLIGLATVLKSHEPNVVRKVRTGSFRQSVVEPFAEFFQRNGAMEILIFIMVYKLSTLMATALTTNFLITLNYSLTMIGTANKIAGLAATIVGALVGGSLMLKLGLKKSLWIFGIAQALAGLTFCILSRVAPGDTTYMKEVWLFIVVSVDNFMMGLGTAALSGFIMSFASKQFTATQLALLTSVMAVSRVILISSAGDLVKWLGWDLFFIATVPLAIPGLLLLLRFDQWQTISTQAPSARIPKFDLALVVLFVVALILLSSDPVFKAAGQPAMGANVKLFGAYAILALVFVGFARPYLAPKAPAKSPRTT